MTTRKSPAGKLCWPEGVERIHSFTDKDDILSSTHSVLGSIVLLPVRLSVRLSRACDLIKIVKP